MNTLLGSVLVIVVLAAVVFLAVRYVWRSHKRGTCVGCSGCSSCSGACPHCQNCREAEKGEK